MRLVVKVELRSSLPVSPSPAQLHHHPKPILRLAPPYVAPSNRWSASSSSSAVGSSSPVAPPPASLEQAGGRMVVELVGAFNELTEKMGDVSLSTRSSRLLFKSLKLAIPILLQAVPAVDGRSPLSRALSVAFILANLQMDAEVISAGILREAIKGKAVTIQDVRDRVGAGVAHLQP